MRKSECCSPLSDPRDDGPGSAPIGTVLGHAAAELRCLCSAAYEVEAAVGAPIDRTDPGHVAGLRGLQELDRLVQHIDGLAVYLAEVARAAEPLGDVDVSTARRTIKLERLAAGLAGRTAAADDGGFELL